VNDVSETRWLLWQWPRLSGLDPSFRVPYHVKGNTGPAFHVRVSMGTSGRHSTAIMITLGKSNLSYFTAIWQLGRHFSLISVHDALLATCIHFRHIYFRKTARNTHSIAYGTNCNVYPSPWETGCLGQPIFLLLSRGWAAPMHVYFTSPCTI